MRSVDESFIDPPHHYNIDDISRIVPSPVSLGISGGPEVQNLFDEIYTCASIIFASLQRLKRLYREMVGSSPTKPGLIADSHNGIDIEVRSFNARMRFNAERRYFDEEVGPEWRCKAHVLDSGLKTPCLIGDLEEHGLLGVVAIWWAMLKATTRAWFDESWELNVLFDSYGEARTHPLKIVSF
jgi:hypothetical protein